MDRLQMPGTIIQLGTVDVVDRVVKYGDIFDWSGYISEKAASDLYFLSGANPAEITRAEDDEMCARNYVVFDCDIRTLLEDIKEECDYQRILLIAKEIKAKLDADQYFNTYSALVFTGNGIHIYFVGDTVDTTDRKSMWKAGYKKMATSLSAVIGYKLDGSCCNVSRITRIPTSFNHKHGKNTAGQILHYQDVKSPILNQMLPLGEATLAEEAQKTVMFDNKSLSAGAEDNYSRINNIPIIEIVLRFFPEWTCDGKNLWPKGKPKGNLAACFISQTGNFIVHGGTRHFSDEKKGYNPFTFVRMMENMGNRGVFEWFKKNFPEVTKEETVVPDADNNDKQSEIIIRATQKQLILFKDQLNDAYAAIKVDSHTEIWPISLRNKNFRLWLFRLGREVLGKAPAKIAIDETISSLEADAIYKGEEMPLNNRIAQDKDGSFWIDMSDQRWRAIHITKEGWTVEENPKILFRRYKHQLPQVEPDQAGDITLLGEFLNPANPEYKNLFYAYCVSVLVPDISIPCLILHGPQGSSKTTIFKMLRALLDPSKLEVLDFSESKREIVQLLDHHRVCYFDNLWRIRKDISDLLCKVVTGSGFSQRELYSDDSDVLRVIKRAIGLNGLELTATKPDLLERSIVIETETINPETRKTEKRLWERFNELKPKILGGMLDLLSAAMKKMSESGVEESNLSRMADFEVWAEAIMMVSKNHKPAGYFRGLYRQNQLETTDKGIEADKVASAVLIWVQMSDFNKWEGTASALLPILSEIASRNNIISVYSRKYWPEEANKLSEKLNLVKPLLALKGIDIVSDRTSRERKITITYNRSKENQLGTLSNEATSPLQPELPKPENHLDGGDYFSQSTEHDDEPPEDYEEEPDEEKNAFDMF